MKTTKNQFWVIASCMAILTSTMSCSKEDNVSTKEVNDAGGGKAQSANTLDVPLGSTTTFFRSGFQANLGISAQSNAKSYFTGVETSGTGADYNWNGTSTTAGDLSLGRTPYNIGSSIYLENPTASNQTASIVTDPTNLTGTNKVLKFEIVNALTSDPGGSPSGVKGRVQLDCKLNGSKFKEYFEEVKMLIPTDFNSLINSSYPLSSTQGYITLFEFFDDPDANYKPDPGSFRLSINVIKKSGALYLQASGQDCGTDNVWRDKYRYDANTPLPIGSWFTLKLYMNQALTVNTGNVQISFNSGNPVLNYNNQLSGYKLDGFEYFYPLKLYASGNAVKAVTDAGKNFKVYYDDFILRFTKR